MDSFPDIDFAIRQMFNQLIMDKVTPWAFFNTGKMKTITDFNGRNISYKGGGLAFDGSPRLCFWNGFIEPFLEDRIIKAFELTRIQAEKKHLPLQVFNHVRALLSNCINEIYPKMQDIDRRLRGKGYPSQVVPFDISGKLFSMEKVIQAYYHASLAQTLEKTGGRAMSKITENALGILKYLIDSNVVSGSEAKVGQLILSTGLKEQDFDAADSYLLYSLA